MMREVAAPPAPAERPLLDEQGYYTVSQAAALLGVSRVTIWRWIRAGHLPASRVGQRTTRIARSDVASALTRLQSDGPRLHWMVRNDRSEPAGGGGDEHIAQFYDEEPTLLRAVSEFLAPALRAGDAAIVIATEAHRAGIEDRLRAADVDLTDALMRGAYVPLDASETLAQLMVDGQPDAARFAAVIGPVIASAGSGGRRVYAFGEMVALLAAVGEHQAAIRLEALWNGFQETHSFSLFCAYPLEVFDEQGANDPFDAVCSEHVRIIPAEGYGVLVDPVDQQREIARLQQRARMLEAEIAQRECAQVALLHKQQELDDFVENAAVGIHRVGSDGQILWANQAELSLLGYPREEYIGRHIAEMHADPETIDRHSGSAVSKRELHNYEARLRCQGRIDQARPHQLQRALGRRPVCPHALLHA